ncbi:conserved hypothetical protein [Formosa agariphila KMM 3901]|uniref:TonB-dependent receptor n=1 Tax=Formosa agariphila (strain DSM 15362 / KCTC 12365 / LMG 23005 / KMM 3901 / M-2Alg 35-1) TaxID=1347342 RepID=T2KLM7_FORAG|nr:conserved hypothetical protein [Formosa agariphila KMM 3901]
MVGETLYYNFYSLIENNKPSSISKIGYVELIGQDGDFLFNHKLKLDEGLGSGDYFIPADIETGQYKLIAYTKWMKNEDAVFISDVYIINPFLKHSNIQDTKSIAISKSKNSAVNSKPIEPTGITIETNSESLKPRRLSSIRLTTNNVDLYNGNYALSVRKISPLEIKNNSTVEGENIIKLIDSSNTLPELRGEIISGTVKNKSNDSLVRNAVVSLSIPGKEFILKNVKTNNSGRFYFSLSENYTSTDVLIQVIDKTTNSEYKIVLDNPEVYDFTNLRFESVYLNPNLKDWLTTTSKYTQIENAYFNSKKDSIINRLPSSLFYVEPDVEYVLDDYKRFPTLKETFVEIIQSGAIRKSKGSLKFKVLEDQTSYYSGYDPLVLFDGILIQNNEDIMNYDARNIERISILSDTYFYGPSVYYGIIDIKTKNGDFVLEGNADNKIYLNLDAPLNSKLFYSPKYDTELTAFNRIPDYRKQLLWLPKLVMDTNSKNIEFYTSSVTGTYEIVLEGFTLSGKHVVIKKTIDVKD